MVGHEYLVSHFFVLPKTATDSLKAFRPKPRKNALDSAQFVIRSEPT